MNKNIISAIVLIIIIGVGGYLYLKDSPTDVQLPETSTTNEEVTVTTEENTASTTEEVDTTKTVIGTSVEERDITAYHYGEGDTELLLVGGIHGGYEWNTVLVAYELMDYLEKNPSEIPANMKVTVIPVLNPDGLNKTVGTAELFTKADVVASKTVEGRFNAHNVDLNRNFDCDWTANGIWQSKTVSGGSKAFSEPESQAIKTYVETNAPTAVVVWYSAAGGVYASNCHDGVLSETTTLVNIFADASGYPAYKNFDYYAITGDMVNWLAKEDVPAISVLLTTHDDTERTKNIAGLQALLKHYAE